MYLTSYIRVASNNLILKTEHGDGNDYVLLLQKLRLLKYVFCYYLHFCLGYTCCPPIAHQQQKSSESCLLT